MKKYLETYYRGIINGLGFLTVIGITGVAYGAYVSMTDVNNGETLTASKFNIVQENIRTLKTTVDGLSNVPAGAVMAFNLSTCPSGWIAANGASGTPDLRGEFIRGLDSGRGVDSGRLIGTSQGDAIRNITGTFGQGFYGEFGNTGVSGVFGNSSTAGNTKYTSEPWVANGPNIIFNASTQVPTANENRPRNVALLYCVKQ